MAFGALERPIFETFLHWCHPYYFHLRGTLSASWHQMKMRQVRNGMIRSWHSRSPSQPTPGLGPLSVIVEAAILITVGLLAVMGTIILLGY